MAAGLGFKDFTTGEVLTAADVDGYLMQGVWVFASAAARDAAVTSPQEGNFAYLKDTNVTTYYTGSSWANLDTTGMTNPMTTTGDTIYSSSGSTPARLGIGSTGNVLTVAGGVPTWAAPAGGGGMTLLSTTTLSGATTTISSISQSYKDLYIVAFGITNNTADGNLTFQIATPSPAAGSFSTGWNFQGTFGIVGGGTDGVNYSLVPAINFNDTVPQNTIVLTIPNYKETAVERIATCFGSFRMGSNSPCNFYHVYGQETSTAVSAISLSNSGGTFSGGTVLVYGVS